MYSCCYGLPSTAQTSHQNKLLCAWSSDCSAVGTNPHSPISLCPLGQDVLHFHLSHTLCGSIPLSLSLHEWRGEHISGHHIYEFYCMLWALCHSEVWWFCVVVCHLPLFPLSLSFPLFSLAGNSSPPIPLPLPLFPIPTPIPAHSHPHPHSDSHSPLPLHAALLHLQGVPAQALHLGSVLLCSCHCCGVSLHWHTGVQLQYQRSRAMNLINWRWWMLFSSLQLMFCALFVHE